MVELIEFTTIKAPIQRCFDLARSVEVHLSGNVHFGEQAVVTGGVSSGLIGLNQQVTWRAKHFGIRQKLTSHITALTPPTYFRDVMIKGAFKSMLHDHYFRPLPGGLTEMKDVFRFAAPVPVIGRIIEKLVLTEYMHALLQERNRVIKEIAESSAWRQYLPESAECES